MFFLIEESLNEIPDFLSKDIYMYAHRSFIYTTVQDVNDMFGRRYLFSHGLIFYKLM